MTTELRPHIARASDRIQTITPLPDGGYAVLTYSGVEMFDAALAPTRMIRGNFGTPEVLADGRMVASAGLTVFERDGSISKIEGIGEWARYFAINAARDGFFAIGTEAIAIDHRGKRRSMPFAEDRVDQGAVAWGDGVVIAGSVGLTYFDAGGNEVARTADALSGAPIVVGDKLVVPAKSEMLVYGERGTLLYRIATPARYMKAFRAGVLTELEAGGVLYVEVGESAGVSRWQHGMKEMKRAFVAGDSVVLATDERVTILDAAGDVRARLDLAWPRDACVFGDGIVLVGSEVVWWRPGNDPVPMPHEVATRSVFVVPAGVASIDHDVMYIWRTDEQGPIATTMEHDLPLGTPLVVGDDIVIVEGAGRFSLSGRSLDGRAVRVHPIGKKWRPMATQEQATTLVARLNGRVFDRPIPEISMEPRVGGITSDLMPLPLDQMVDLYGRSMFAASTLDRAVLDRIGTARDRFFDEIASVLKVKKRQLVAAIRARKTKLEPPRLAPGYEYLGTFTTTGRLTIADPCYVGKKPVNGFSFALKVDAREGLWHTFVRPLEADSDRNAELVVVHENAFDVHANKEIGYVHVDAGCAGVFDKACPKIDLDMPLEEGAAFGLGAVAHSGYGDGSYPAFANAGSVVSKIRIVFGDDAPERDRLVMQASSANAKPYSAAAKFAVGDAIEHVKFGLGAVVRVGGDGKMDVRFADATRTLVHAKK